ncbi:MAG: hypothetical protein ACK5HR_06165 [Mycoplasmatales bacterium]
MNKILTNTKIVDDALNYGYKYVENNQFKKGIKYLEFASQTVKKDQYLLYALIVAYYNIGNITKVKQFLAEIKNLEIDNMVIKEAVEQINEELKIKKILENENIIPKSTFDSIDNIKKIKEKLQLTPEELKEIARNSRDIIYKFLNKPNFEDDSYKIFEKQYTHFLNSLIMYEKFKNYYLTEKEYNNLNLYSFYNASLKTVGHSAFMIKLSKDKILKNILNNSKISQYLKNEIIYDLNIFYKKKYLSIEDLEDKLENEDLLNLDIKGYQKKLVTIEKSLVKTPLYKEPKLFNYAISIIVKFLRIRPNIFAYLEVQEIEKKILEYFYFSNITLSTTLEVYIKENYELDEEEYKNTAKLINKITLIL